jgi:hypothetical protein|tara:strand:- start:2441 stop:2683 length:243 start_codon:yes stop_codon:yes gene_type:complete
MHGNSIPTNYSVTPVLPIHVLSDYTRTYDLGRQDVTSHITHSTTGNGPVRVSEVNYITYTEKGELTHAPKMIGNAIDLIA